MDLRSIGFLLLLGLPLLVAFFRPIGDGFDGEDMPGELSVLRVGFVPSNEDPERVLNSFVELRNYLQRELEMPVRLVEIGTYAPAIEAMRTGKLDVCFLHPFSFLLAADRAGARAIVVRGTEAGGPGAYRTLIVTHRSSGLDSIDDVFERANKLSFSFTDPASSSGHLVPRAFFETRGLVPEESFRRVLFAMNHGALLLAVANERVDVAAVSINAYNTLLRQGRIDPDSVRILWESPLIPSGAITVRGGLEEGLVHAIQSAFVEMRHRSPETWAVVSGQYLNPDLIYLPGDCALYDELRSVASGIQNMRLLR